MKSRLNLDLSENDSEIDMTPMLDIVFIMLIFFIVSSNFIREAGVEINRPTASTAEQKENAGIMIAITPDDQIWLDQKQIDIRMIRPTLEKLKVEQPNIGILIQSDQDARTGTLIKVMDQVKLAGIEQIAVATKKGAS
ncbi:ExbD/TolR family protein [Alkalimarinus alittae]|uniref:Biopolymer transporter ExbD n=1 Tax=Alkalimarinus alittae TaxID=2961619 RepID=A0ABY6N509_9ALTE|nr:biopolymer transporter ExbD [Alkalimarinus alittae]UZE97072.1 biopolymer transporter ExbD [Alkalimarinus alittae]